MNCEDVRAEIELYVLGGSDKITGRLLEEHLSRCPPCRAGFQSWGRTIRLGLSISDRSWERKKVLDDPDRPVTLRTFEPSLIPSLSF